MEHPSGDFEAAVEAMANVIRRLRIPAKGTTLLLAQNGYSPCRKAGAITEVIRDRMPKPESPNE